MRRVHYDTVSPKTVPISNANHKALRAIRMCGRGDRLIAMVDVAIEEYLERHHSELLKKLKQSGALEQ